MSVVIQGCLRFDSEHVWWSCGDINRELYRPGQTGEQVATALAHICYAHAQNQRFRSTGARVPAGVARARAEAGEENSNDGS